ncbi:unnamed protein product [Cuscuta europaea]|uniref:RNase H type-1 domain-containing protein n=1 Tax=Cuscuta europaea TaxID=41803 RepID=A0A9P1EJM7_CUSEU|nr:unnamed protein product [Cuscuta europaea]
MGAAVLRGWKTAQIEPGGTTKMTCPATGWNKPAEGKIKINVDAALDAQNNRRAWAWVVRDSQGRFIGSGWNVEGVNWST